MTEKRMRPCNYCKKSYEVTNEWRHPVCSETCRVARMEGLAFSGHSSSRHCASCGKYVPNMVPHHCTPLIIAHDGGEIEMFGVRFTKQKLLRALEKMRDGAGDGSWTWYVNSKLDPRWNTTGKARNQEDANVQIDGYIKMAVSGLRCEPPKDLVMGGSDTE